MCVRVYVSLMRANPPLILNFFSFNLYGCVVGQEEETADNYTSELIVARSLEL